MKQECPVNREGIHKYTYSVGGGTKGDFVPLTYGDSYEATTYKRVEYSYMACSCGQVKKSKVVMEDA